MERQTEQNALHLDSIGQIHLTVGDLDRAVAFYRDTLGMPLLFHLPEQGMAFLDCGGVRLYLGRAETPDLQSHPLIYYRVASIDSACAALRARGVELTEEPHVVHRAADHDLWMAALRDPDGHVLCLMSEVPSVPCGK